MATPTPTYLTIADISGSSSLQVSGQPLVVKAQFNPTELSITTGANYAEIPIPGLAQPLLQFIRGETRTLTCELFFDGSTEYATVTRISSPDQLSERDPTHPLSILRRFAEIDSDLHAPPLLSFTWSTNIVFQGVITQLQERFVLFGDNGELLRARVNLTAKSYVPAAAQVQEIKPASPDRFKTRVVKLGDRIESIAAEQYGDAKKWPVIAAYNNLARPRVLQVGMVLQIPPL